MARHRRYVGVCFLIMSHDIYSLTKGAVAVLGLSCSCESLSMSSDQTYGLDAAPSQEAKSEMSICLSSTFD